VTHAPDEGFSLIEVVIVVMLMGLVITSVLSSVITSIATSSVTRLGARVETVIVNAADRVNRAPKACDYAPYAQAAAQTEGWSPSTTTVTQEYLVPGASPTAQGAWQSGTGTTPACPTGTLTDLLVQRVSITVTSPNGRVSRFIQVVKSDV
jgi:type II secretory pathway pseudopilin PulG